ncbi:MAG: hypothetical protein GY838_13450, partial [bacterium]|nr:hypothetical protein [bacterium]
PARRSRATAKDMLSGERTFAEFLQDQAAELASSVIGPPLHMVGRKPSEGLRLASAAYLSKRPVTASDLDESTLFLKPGSEMVELKFRNPFQPAEKGKGYLIPAIGGGGYGLENPLGSLDFDLSEEGEDAVDLLDLAVIPTPMKHVKTMSKIMAGERKQAVIGQFPPDSPAGKRFGAGETVGGPVRAELPLDVAQHGIEDMSVARGKAKVTPKSPRKKLVEPYMLKQDVPIYHETSAGEFRQFTEVPITDVLKSKSGGPPYPLGTQGTDMVFDRGLVFTDTPPTRGSGFIEKLQRRPGGGIVRRQVLRKGTPVLDTTNIQRGELPMAVDSVILGMEELGEMALTNKVAISAARRKILGALENNHDIVVKSGKLRFDSDDLTSLGHPSDIALRGTKRVPWDLLAKPDDWRDVDHVMAEMGRVWGSYSGFPVHKRESLFDPAFFGGKAGGHEYVVSDYDVLNDPRKLGPQVDNLFDFYEKRISEAPPSGFTSNARVWMQSGGNRHSIHSDNLRRVFEDIQDLDVDVPLWHVTTADAKVGQMGLRSATQLNQQKVLAVHAAHDRALKATDADFADPLDALDFVDKTDFGSVDKLADADYVDRLVKKARPAGLGGSPGMVSVTFLEDHAGMIEERLRYAALAARGDLDIDESMSLAGQWLEDAARDLGGDLNTMEMFAAITNRTYCMSDRTFRMYEDVLEGIEDPPPGFITRMKAIRVAARDAGLPEPTLPELIGDTDLNLLSRIMEGPQGVRPFGVIQNADWVAAGTADINRHLADSFTSPGGVVMTGTESSYAKLRPEEITTYRVAVRYGAESWKAIYNEAEIRFDPNDVWLLSR